MTLESGGYNSARSEKFVRIGLMRGFGGIAPSRRRIGGLKAEPPNP